MSTRNAVHLSSVTAWSETLQWRQVSDKNVDTRSLWLLLLFVHFISLRLDIITSWINMAPILDPSPLHPGVFSLSGWMFERLGGQRLSESLLLLNPTPVLSSPMLNNVFLSQMRIVSEKNLLKNNGATSRCTCQVFFFFLLLLVMLTCQFFYLSKNKHVNVNKYKYVIWKQDSRQQFTAEELEKAHWAPNHRQTDRRCGQLVGEHIGYLAAKEGDIFLQISDKSGFSFCYFRTSALWWTFPNWSIYVFIS